MRVHEILSELTYLCFPDEKTAQAVTGWWSNEAGWAAPTKSLQFAVRGTLYNDDGEYDADGNVTKEPTQQAGFFIDVIYGDIPEAARHYIVTPSNPKYVLA